MTTYHFTDTVTVGDVYLSLSAKGASSGLCIFKDCSDCKLRAVCGTNNASTRLKAALKLAPNLLTNFPELGV